MINSWKKALSHYHWIVNLKTFHFAHQFPGHFNRTIDTNNLKEFEKAFKNSVNSNLKTGYLHAGEVCYWKNFGVAQSRNRITVNLLKYLAKDNNWSIFIEYLLAVVKKPSYENFEAFTNACNQPYGFATPITFIAFYNPEIFPMVDKHIALWWNAHASDYQPDNRSVFSLLNGVINKKISNWKDYLEWTIFCNDYSKKVSEIEGFTWRSRDIEMAVWEAQKNNFTLEIIP